MTIGDTAAVDPESAVNSKYIILWANNMLSTNSHMWPFVLEARQRGAKIVVIDPFKTATAKQADWHIAIRPGTDGALVLGLIHVIVADGLTDDDYIEKYTVGFDELKARAAEFTPEKTAEITGISADTIRTLAREYATAHAPLVRIGVPSNGMPAAARPCERSQACPHLWVPGVILAAACCSCRSGPFRSIGVT